MISLLHQTVEQSAQRSPLRQAFCCGKDSIDYGQWDERSSQLANTLIEQGVKKGDRVGIFMPRSVETAVSVYGTMKAGAAFVPIDPGMPAGGVDQLIQNCGIRYLISHDSKLPVLQKLSSKLRTLVGANVPLEHKALNLVSWQQIGQQSRENPGIPVGESDLAYIMYSSGSTGRPKGIMHSHYSGTSYARLSVQTYDVRPEDRIANHSPLHFDMSTFGFFSSPMAGATTVMIPEAYTKVPSSLAKLIEQERISIWYSVPLALTQLLLRAPLDSMDMSSIRWVLYGGEPFPPKHLYRLMSMWPQTQVSNVYGPAEVNQCTYFHLDSYAEEFAEETEEQLQSRIESATTIPIGKVWDETEYRILDENDQQVTTGQPGQLVIHSSTMMQGYWENPERNTLAWYQEPRHSDTITFYRTGDLVQQQPDGNLQFLGRMDRQIKVRGYRVELDDIEHALAGIPQVEEAAVFSVLQSDDTKTVEAVAIMAPAAATTGAELLESLSQTLSPYSIPTRLDIVSQLPRTTSGKIDRTKLQRLAEERQPGNETK